MADRLRNRTVEISSALAVAATALLNTEALAFSVIVSNLRRYAIGKNDLLY